MFAKVVGTQSGVKKRTIWVAKPIVTNLLGPNLVGDQLAQTWSIGVLEGIGDLDTLWRIKGSSSFILSQAKSFGLSSFYLISNVPPCGNSCLNCLHWKLLAPLHVLVLFLACVCICCASNCLSWVIKYVCVGLHIMYVCVMRWAFVLLDFYLSWLLWEINGTSHFGGVMCFVHLTIL